MLLQTLKQSPRSSRNTLLVSLLIIAAIAAYNWIITPHLNFLEAAQKYEVVAQRHARKNEMIDIEVTARKEELAQLRRKLKDTAAKLFDPSAAKQFFNDIETLAQEAECTVRSLHFSATSAVNNVGRLTTGNQITEDHASLTVTGTYSQILALMRRLQDRPELVTVDVLKIRPDTENPGRLTCQTTVKIYVIEKGQDDSHD